MMATALLKRFSQWTAIALLLFIIFGRVGTPALASILRTADSGAIVVQSRRTVRDQHRQSWQVIAFKQVQPDAPKGNLPEGKLPEGNLSNEIEAIYLRLVAFPGSVAIDHPQPILLSNVQGQVWTVADRSDQISASAQLSVQQSVGQYELQSVLPALSDQTLRLEIPVVDQDAIVLRIPPALIQEWQTVAQTVASQLVQDCDRFPLEARQNPAFPEWTGCHLAR